MTDLQGRISGVVLNRLADYGISIDREVADSVAEAVMAMPGIAITDVDATEPVAKAIFAKRRHHEPVHAWDDLYPDEMDSYRAMARAALLAAAVQAQEEQQ